MAVSGSEQRKGPGLGATLREDFSQPGFWQSLRREFRELKDFCVDDEKALRLTRMGRFKRWLSIGWWILEGMILRLTPTRRILVLVGIIILLIRVSSGTDTSTNNSLIGGLLILFVLMLELKDRLLASDELQSGRAVQHALMPEQHPHVPGWSLWLSSRSANEVGGDLVDFLPITPDRIGIVLADITGKGLKAALLMAKLQTMIRTLAPDYTSIGSFAAKVNEVFRRDGLPNIFASMVYGEIAPDSGELRLVNAGHFPPLVLRSDSILEMAKGEPALGLMSGTAYSEQNIRLRGGDGVLWYSDGLIEARNDRGEFFGIERLLTLLPSLRGLSAPEIGQAIIAAVDRFAGEVRQYDDLSLVVLKSLSKA